MDNRDAKQNSQRVWGATPAGSSFAPQYKPGSREFFETVYQRRSTYEMPWLYELLSFGKHKHHKVLELGCGAGYDAFNFCRNGADYIGMDLAPQNPKLVMTHLNYYDLHPRTIIGDAENIMFEGNTFDLVYSNGVLHHTPDIRRSFEEAFRVLKENGEFWVIVYNKHSFFYWLNVFLWQYLLRGGFRKRSLAEQRSLIEFTTSNKRPLVNVYSKRHLQNLLNDVGFHVNGICVRKLVVDDFPHIPVVAHYMYPVLPQSGLNQLAKIGGWYLIAKACKPLSV